VRKEIKEDVKVIKPVEQYESSERKTPRKEALEVKAIKSTPKPAPPTKAPALMPMPTPTPIEEK